MIVKSLVSPRSVRVHGFASLEPLLIMLLYALYLAGAAGMAKKLSPRMGVHPVLIVALLIVASQLCALIWNHAKRLFARLIGNKRPSSDLSGTAILFGSLLLVGLLFLLNLVIGLITND